MSTADIAGLLGVFMMLGAYGAASLGRMDPTRAPALAINLTGAMLVLYSLSEDFNLAAAIMETAWATFALVGLVRISLRRRGDQAAARASADSHASVRSATDR